MPLFYLEIVSIHSWAILACVYTITWASTYNIGLYTLKIQIHFNNNLNLCA